MFSQLKSCVLLFALILIFSTNSVCVAQSASENWPEFRGPNGNGHATGDPLPLDFSKHIKWETPIHGRGWSSPVVWGNQIWLTTATDDGKEMFGVCVALDTGKILHDLLVHENEEPSFSHPTNSYASPTPAIESGRVYLHFGSYGTTCIDTETGEQVWQRLDLECDHYRGPASSPILFEDKLIVALDGFDQQYVIAFDKNTGETVWKTNREIEYETDSGDWKKAYGTGQIFDVDGKQLLVYPSAKATVAYEPNTGKPIWTFYHDGMNASARPQSTAEGFVLVTNGMGSMHAIKPNGAGDISKSNEAWMTTKGVAKRPSPVIVGNRIYSFTDKGVASCIDSSNGNLIWQERVGGSFAASPIYDGEKIFAFDEDGKILVIKPGEEFELLGEFKLGDGFKASPAVVGDQVILRSISKLYRISESK